MAQNRKCAPAPFSLRHHFLRGGKLERLVRSSFSQRPVEGAWKLRPRWCFCLGAGGRGARTSANSGGLWRHRGVFGSEPGLDIREAQRQAPSARRFYAGFWVLETFLVRCHAAPGCFGTAVTQHRGQRRSDCGSLIHKAVFSPARNPESDPQTDSSTKEERPFDRKKP